MDTPGQLSETLIAQSAEFGKLSDQLAEVLKAKPGIWMHLRETTKSDTSAERAWASTEQGIAETVLKLKLKSLEKSMSAIKTRLKVLSDEAHNIY